MRGVRAACTSPKAHLELPILVPLPTSQLTGRKCDACGGRLRDTILDWEDELPDPDYPDAVERCEEADLCITLGTSLRITPAGQMPMLSKKFAVVNLQETPYDEQAVLVIRAKVDQVMEGLLVRIKREMGRTVGGEEGAEGRGAGEKP